MDPVPMAIPVWGLHHLETSEVLVQWYDLRLSTRRLKFNPAMGI